MLNAYSLGAQPANRKEETYKCSMHGTIDCSDCFDWKALILRFLEGLQNSAKGATDGVKGATKRDEKKMNVHDVD